MTSMNFLKHIIFSMVLLALLSVNSNGQKAVKDHEFGKHHFAFNLAPSGNSQFFNLAEVTVYEGKIVEIKHLTVDEFVKCMAGILETKANPDKENFFEKYGIKGCDVHILEDGFSVFDCELVWDLWRLRYDKNPAKTAGREQNQSDDGWSRKKYIPSEGQMQILQRYGIRHISEFFYGENAYKLLRDMSNPNWVQTYRGS